MLINEIFVHPECFNYLSKRNLLKIFAKTLKKIEIGDIGGGTNLKKRKPLTDNVWYFRINRKRRALCSIDDMGNLYITEIDDHQ